MHRDRDRARAPATTITNLAYLRQHDAAAALPVLSMRRPLHSLRLLLGDRQLAARLRHGDERFPALCGRAGAGLALARAEHLRRRHRRARVCLRAHQSPAARRARVERRDRVRRSACSRSQCRSSAAAARAATARLRAILVWLGASAAAALLVLLLGRTARRRARWPSGIAGGLFFSIGDISTKLATQGGTRIAFLRTVVLGYALGTTLLQLGYQRGSALTVAGLATLLTNALPIAAGTVVLEEPVPSGAFGGLRVLAFAAVTVGAFLLVRPRQTWSSCEHSAKWDLRTWDGVARLPRVRCPSRARDARAGARRRLAARAPNDDGRRQPRGRFPARALARGRPPTTPHLRRRASTATWSAPTATRCRRRSTTRCSGSPGAPTT